MLIVSLAIAVSVAIVAISVPAAERDLVYKVPGMEQTTVRSNIAFKTVGDSQLHADFYLPTNLPGGAKLPVILFVLGDAPPNVLKNAKDWRFMQSYGRLAAASQMCGVTFNHRSSENFTKLPDVRSDILDALRFVQLNSLSLPIDTNRFCLWFFSGSGPHLGVGSAASQTAALFS